MERKPLPIGISDFKKLREDDRYYIDKTLLAEEVLKSSGEIILLPRPRRFGKTMNLSMLRYFFERQNAEKNATLFKGLTIQQSEVWKHQGRHPVVFLTFKDVKEKTAATTVKKILDIVHGECVRHKYLLESEEVEPFDKQELQALLQNTSEQTKLEKSLLLLCRMLEAHHGEKVVLLLDEYDTPVHSAHSEGFFNDFMGFYRNFLSAGLKDNEHLKKGVVTGILRVAKESIFSGLNNPVISTVLSHAFSDKFGLTDQEVHKLLADYGLESHYTDVAHWYNGYTFGQTTIYNPWSLLNYVSTHEEGFKIHWVNTAQNTLIKDQMRFASLGVKRDFADMMNGVPVRRTLQEYTSFDALNEFNEEALYCLLVFAGYLKAQFDHQDGRKRFFNISIPNEEVKTLYEDFMAEWLGAGLSTERTNYLLEFLLEGNLEDFQLLLSEYVETAFSYFDFDNREPEKMYHSFILGLLAQLSTSHHVRSNRESGFGRADVLISPKSENDKRAYVMELKTVAKHKGEDLEIATKNALQQIEDKKYVSELKAQGKTDIFRYGIAFDGKEVLVKLVREEE